MVVSKFRKPCLVLREKTSRLFFSLLKEVNAHFLGSNYEKKRNIILMHSFMLTKVLFHKRNSQLP